MTLKLCSTYFATGQFVGEDFVGSEGEAHLQHLGRNKIYPEKDYRGGIYWLPIDEVVDAENWQEVRGRRATYELPPLQVSLRMESVEGDLTYIWLRPAVSTAFLSKLSAVLRQGGPWRRKACSLRAKRQYGLSQARNSALSHGG